ncbi:MAG: hypothetical protein JEZ11_24570 [Desulfobacterales bacterium]|nr:hypothetical protein [Desulfobacterales bacterium]
MEKLTLNEFCRKLSLTDKRVELIGGFHFWMENTQKVAKAAPVQFQKYYTEFINLPA